MSSRFIRRLLAAVATIIVVVTGLLFWRLSAGPVRLDFLAPALESALSQPDRGYLVRFADIWLDAADGLSLTAHDARIVAPEGTVLASSPEVRLGISRQALLRGVLAPSWIDLADVRVRLYRTMDGSLRFTLADVPGDSRGADAEAFEFDISDFLREPNPEKSTGYLRRLRVSDGAVLLIDERSGTVWRAPGSNFSIARDQEQITAGLGTTIDAPGGEQRLDASGGLDLASGEAWLDLRVGGFRLARLSPLVPALEQARAIDMAFDATASARFDAEGSIKQARFQINGRDGSLSLGGTGVTPVPVAALDISGSVGPGGESITVEEISATFGESVIEARGTVALEDDAVRIDGRISRLDSAAIGEILPSIPEARQISLALEGEFSASLSEEGELDRIEIDLRGTGGKLTVATEPVPLAELSGSASVDGSSGEITVPRLFLDLGGPVLEASGQANPTEGGWQIDGEAVARDLPVGSLDQLWPPQLAAGARRWVTENLSDGRVSEARLAVSTSTGSAGVPDGAEEMSGSLAFEGVTARYWEPLPPFEKVRGGATFAGRVFDVELESGHLGNIDLEKGHVLLTGLGLEAGKELGDIDVTLAGPLSEILTVLDRPPLGYAKWLKIDPAQVGGEATASLAVELPLLDDLSIEEIDIAAEADLRNVSIPAIAVERDLTEADLELKVDKTKLELSGEGELAGVPVRLDVTQAFEGEDRGSRIHVAGVLSDENRAAIDPIVASYVAGPVPIELTMTEGPEGRRTVQADFVLDRAELSLPFAEWSKEAGAPGTATVRLQLNGDRLVGIDHFEINAGSGYAVGRGSVSENGGLDRVQMDRLRLGDRTDLQASLAFGADGTTTVQVSGGSVDLSPLMRRLDQPGGDRPREADSSDIVLDAKLGQVWIGARYPLLDVDGHMVFDGDTLQGGEARGEIGEGNVVHLVVGEGEGNRRLRLVLDDAGAALRTLGWIDSISGGRVEIDAVREIGPDDAPWRGKAESDEFRISGAPLAARLLAAASFTGLADLSSRDAGITFDKLEAPFELGEGRLKLEPGRAYGAALGVTFFGSVDTTADNIDLAGTIVPAYALNRVLGSIPLLGNLLTGEEGSGLFAATYRATGPLDEPAISVNPLAALAPGFLRNLFGEIAGEGSGTQEPVTDPAAERFPGNLN